MLTEQAANSEVRKAGLIGRRVFSFSLFVPRDDQLSGFSFSRLTSWGRPRDQDKLCVSLWWDRVFHPRVLLVVPAPGPHLGSGEQPGSGPAEQEK